MTVIVCLCVPVFRRVQAVSDLPSGGQVLLDSATFKGVHSKLNELGARVLESIIHRPARMQVGGVGGCCMHVFVRVQVHTFVCLLVAPANLPVLLLLLLPAATQGHAAFLGGAALPTFVGATACLPAGPQSRRVECHGCGQGVGCDVQNEQGAGGSEAE